MHASVQQLVWARSEGWSPCYSRCMCGSSLCTSDNASVQAQATTALSDGRIFVIGGSWTGGLGGKNGEVYTDGAGWRLLPG